MVILPVKALAGRFAGFAGMLRSKYPQGEPIKT
jgi:hypothetical protein